MADRLSKAKDFASAKWADVSATVSTQRKIRGLRNEITDLVRSRDRLMSEMGHKVYALYARDKVRNADLLAICERVDEINESINDLNRQVQELAKPRPQGEVDEVEVEDETEIAEDVDEGEDEPGEPDEDEEMEEEEEEAPEEATESDDEPEQDPD
jgi:seryl-tRNA synthetase